MVRVLVAGLVAMVIAVAVGPTFIEWLRRQSIGQHIREERPGEPHGQAGDADDGRPAHPRRRARRRRWPSRSTRSPASRSCSRRSRARCSGSRTTTSRLRRRRSLGLTGRWKMLGLLLVVTAGVGWATTRIGYMDTEIYFPLVDVNIDLHWLYFPFLFLVIAGTSNGVNLTDGIDGLAAGTCAISLITLLAIALDRLDPLGRHRRGPERRVPRHRDRLGGADRRRDRLPLVQRVPGRDVHGRHRLDGARRARSRRSRSSPRRRSCSSSSAACS